MHRSYERCRRFGQHSRTDVTDRDSTAFDFSTFKNFQLNERFSMQFRSEFFNILNHPNFNAPNFGGNGVISVAILRQLHTVPALAKSDPLAMLRTIQDKSNLP